MEFTRANLARCTLCRARNPAHSWIHYRRRTVAGGRDRRESRDLQSHQYADAALAAGTRTGAACGTAQQVSGRASREFFLLIELPALPGPQPRLLGTHRPE